MTTVSLVQHLDGGRCGNTEVRRLAAETGEPCERAPGELDEVGPGGLPASEAEQHRPRLDRPAGRIALDEPLALERADEA